MVLIDASAWVEFLRDTGSTVCRRVDELLDAGIAGCDAIRMEVLAGARDELHPGAAPPPGAGDRSPHGPRALRGSGCPVPSLPPARGDGAPGETVRRLIDCLIAAVAIRSGAPILHRDGDFDVLARHPELEVAR